MSDGDVRRPLEKLRFGLFKVANARFQNKELLFVQIRRSFGNSQALGQFGYDLLLLVQLAALRVCFRVQLFDSSFGIANALFCNLLCGSLNTLLSGEVYLAVQKFLPKAANQVPFGGCGDDGFVESTLQ